MKPETPENREMASKLEHHDIFLYITETNNGKIHFQMVEIGALFP